jgi:hypothetical protein
VLVGVILLAASKFAVASPALESAGGHEVEEDEEMESAGILAKTS